MQKKMGIPLIVIIFFYAMDILQACEILTSPTCKRYYNISQMPNWAGQTDQIKAGLEMNQYIPLVRIGCDHGLQKFLCEVFFPECITGPDGTIQPLTAPCRNECQRVERNCGPLLQKFGFAWPQAVNCDKFPSTGECSEGSYRSCRRSMYRHYTRPCIQYMTSIARDTSAFWFGSRYTTQCPSGPSSNWSCGNPRAGYNDSIESRLNGAINIDNLSTFLSITYASPPGKTNACGVSLTQYSNHTFSIYPSKSITWSAWDVRFRPSVQWKAEGDTLYSLLIYDIALLSMHGTFVNIQGGDLTISDTVLEYISPAPPTINMGVYVFLLFEQSTRISDEVIQAEKFVSSTDSFSRIVTTLGLSHLIGINLVNVRRDLYSAHLLQTNHIADICPDIHGKSLELHRREFLPKNINLDVTLNITYYPKPITYTSCCSVHNTTDDPYSPDPLRNGSVNTATVRTEVFPNVTLVPGGYIPATMDDLYTLIMVDPDVSHSSLGTQERPFVHWLIINIPGNSTHDGVTVHSYRGPTPPPPSRHHHGYYFLLYKQSRALNVSSLQKFAEQQCPFPGRCLFDIKRFAREESASLVGANWMFAHYDAYVRYIYVNGKGQDQDAVCNGVHGYSKTCHESVPIVVDSVFG